MRIALIANIRARLGGYFWLPCPLCGRMFGGHEQGGMLYLGPAEGQMTCPHPVCMKTARQLSQHRMDQMSAVRDAIVAITSKLTAPRARGDVAEVGTYIATELERWLIQYRMEAQG